MLPLCNVRTYHRAMVTLIVLAAALSVSLLHGHSIWRSVLFAAALWLTLVVALGAALLHLPGFSELWRNLSETIP